MARTAIQHLGITCKSIEDGLSIFGLDMKDIVESYLDAEQHNMLYFIYLPCNRLWLEFVVPINQESTVYSAIKRSDVTLHHLGFETKDLDKEIRMMSRLEGCFELGSYRLRIRSFGGNIRTKFFALKGVIIEFVESTLNP